MSRCAEWRRLPGDSAHGLGRIGQFARDLWLFYPLKCAGVLLAMFGPPITAWIATDLIVGGKPGVFAGLAVFYALLTLLFVFRKRLEAPTPLGSLETLLPLPLPERTFPVYLEIRDKKALTGLDEGVACFVEGWLHFDGVRTDFDVRAGDGRGEWRTGETLHIAFPKGQGLVVRLMDDRGLKPSRDHFRHAANLWISDADRPQGESILPPESLHPSVHALRTIQTAGGASLLLLAPVLAVLLLPRTGVRSWAIQALWVLGAALFSRGAFALDRGERQGREARFPLARKIADREREAS